MSVEEWTINYFLLSSSAFATTLLRGQDIKFEQFLRTA